MSDTSKKSKTTINPIEAVEGFGNDVKSGVGNLVGPVTELKTYLGGLSTLSDEEAKKAEVQEKAKAQKEAEELRGKMKVQGRDVGAEMLEISNQRKKEEEEKEQLFLRELEEKRAREKQEMQAQIEVSTPMGKRKKKRGSALAPGKVAKPDDISATGEFVQKAE